VPDEKRVRSLIRKTLEDVERIHSFVHPDYKEDLDHARRFREDAVRMTVLQMSLSIETLLDGLFMRAFLGHEPRVIKRGERMKRKQKGKRLKKLDELLRGGRFGFESKLRLASILGLTLRSQDNRLDKLRALRNKCAHSWGLDTIHKRGRKPRPTRRLLEFEGGNLFDLKVLEKFVKIYRAIYLDLVIRYTLVPIPPPLHTQLYPRSLVRQPLK
jgi:hypothetical protein